MKRAVVVTGALVAVVLAAIPLALAAARAQVSQPIAFNHRIHLEGAGLACVDCHLHAVDGAHATIPELEVCAACHAEPQGKSAAEAQVVEHVGAGTPIPWVQVHRVPPHVYFSHRRHAALGKIACETCHGNVRERVRPFTRAAVRPRMSWCTGCHEKSDARNDCVGCHR